MKTLIETLLRERRACVETFHSCMTQRNPSEEKKAEFALGEATGIILSLLYLVRTPEAVDYADMVDKELLCGSQSARRPAK